MERPSESGRSDGGDPGRPPRFDGLAADILESIEDGFYAVDAEWRFVYVNGRACEMWGVTRESLIGRILWERFPEFDSVESAPRLRAAAAGAVNTEFEFYSPLVRRWLWFRVCPIRDGITGVYWRDVTERKRIDETLRQNAALFRRVFEQSPLGKATAGTDMLFREVNPALCEMLGYSAEELRQRSFLDLVHPDDRAVCLQHAQALAAGEVPQFQIEERFLRKSGEPLWVRITVAPIRDALDQIVYSLGIVENIDESKRMRDALADDARTLETLNRTWALIAGDLDLERVLQAVTDAATELSGAAFGSFFYNVGEGEGASYMLYTLSGVPREAFAQFPMPRNTAVFGPTFRGEGIVRSDDILADPRYGKNAPHHGMPEGHLPVRSYLAVPVTSRSGEVIGGLFFGHPQPGVFTERAERIVAGIASQAAVALDHARLYRGAQREIESRTAAEAQLQHLNEMLEQRVAAEVAERLKAEEALRQAQKMEVVGQLTGGIAHDFNNLLTVVIGNLDTLERQLADRPDLTRAVTAALRGADRAATLTNRLLAFSRRQALQPKPVDANKLIAGMSDLLQRTLGENIAIETVLAGALWRSFADLNQLENAVLNLAVNARDAMAAGGKLTLETANTYLDSAYADRHEEVTAGQYVMIAVSDTGAGMSRETIEKAFEPFYTTKDVGQGTGLGLSQVYGFVKQSGGHVKIYSEAGKGTTVKLYLPRLTTGEQSIDAVDPAAAVPTGTREETILVVEDDEDVRSYTAEVLRELGYRVLGAGDAAAALHLLGLESGIRLLFTDVGLPGSLDGRALAAEACRRHPGLKILFTTGYGGGRSPGEEVDDLIVKPFTYALLGAKIRQVLGERPAG